MLYIEASNFIWKTHITILCIVVYIYTSANYTYRILLLSGFLQVSLGWILFLFGNFFGLSVATVSDVWVLLWRGAPAFCLWHLKHNWSDDAGESMYCANLRRISWGSQLKILLFRSSCLYVLSSIIPAWNICGSFLHEFKTLLQYSVISTIECYNFLMNEITTHHVARRYTRIFR